MSRVFGLFGAGGFAREVMPIARQTMPRDTVFYFVQTTPEYSTLNGMPVISEAEFAALTGEKTYAIGIADAVVRSAIARRMHGIATPAPLIAPNVIVGDANTLSEGIVLCPFTCVTGNSTIGQHFQANIYSYVGHDCVIGDYVTFAPSVKCNGNVHIGNNAYIGTGAIIRQGSPEKPVTIGENAIIGMGAVVTKSVPANITVIGNPARPLTKN